MVIYKVTNLLDGMIYVGQDTKNRDTYYGSGLLIKRAISKYGKQNFKREILEHCKTKEQLNEREVFWIRELKAIENGYNICKGGQGQNTDEVKKRFSESRKGVNNSMFGRKHTDRVRKIISEKNKGRKWTAERKQRASESMLNRNFSEEKKQEISKKISEKLKGRPKSKEHREKLSKANLGKTSPRKGVKMSEESKKKLSESTKGRIPWNKGRAWSEEEKKKISEGILKKQNKK
jgi:group I intron endonuclease